MGEIAEERGRRCAADRWFDIWRVIFPEVPLPPPGSPYSSGLPVLVQRLIDIRVAIMNNELVTPIPGISWTNTGQDQQLISDELISLAIFLEDGLDGATPLYL